MPPKQKQNNPPGLAKGHKKRRDNDSDADSNQQDPATFESYSSVADTFQKHGEYSRAIESYTKALELRPGEKNCLVARSRCYLLLGKFQAALSDAEATIEDNKDYIKGLYQKAEALYQGGNFEMALVQYHRGHKLRPELREFQLGVQKATEAIDNSIGDSAGLKLENKGDLSYFYQQEEEEKTKKKQKQGGYNKPAAKKDPKKEERKTKLSSKDSKTVKQLLGELYADREYLEKLWKDEDLTQRKTETSEKIRELAREGLDYLDTRTDFWQQQKPMYSRKRDKQMREKSNKNDNPTNYVLKNLEEIDQAQAEGRFQDSLDKAKKTLNTVQKWSDDDVPNRAEVIANLHSCIGNAHLELNDHNKALRHHEQDLEIARQNELDDAKSRALDNLGRVYARMGKFEKAIEVWEEKLPLSKSALESTWLYHEIGRCHLEMMHYQKAKEYGEKSFEAAQESEDDIWQLNANVLVAQSEVKLGDYQSALEYFEKSLEMAKLQGDTPAEKAITKAIEDVNSRIVKDMKEGSDKGSQKGQDETYDDEQFEDDKGEEDDKGRADSPQNNDDTDRPASSKSNHSHKSDKSNHSHKSDKKEDENEEQVKA